MNVYYRDDRNLLMASDNNSGVSHLSQMRFTRQSDVIRSVAVGFGRHGMPPPASNDTGTAFCFPN